MIGLLGGFLGAGGVGVSRFLGLFRVLLFFFCFFFFFYIYFTLYTRFLFYFLLFIFLGFLIRGGERGEGGGSDNYGGTF